MKIKNIYTHDLIYGGNHKVKVDEVVALNDYWANSAEIKTFIDAGLFVVVNESNKSLRKKSDPVKLDKTDEKEK